MSIEAPHRIYDRAPFSPEFTADALSQRISEVMNAISPYIRKYRTHKTPRKKLLYLANQAETILKGTPYSETLDYITTRNEKLFNRSAKITAENGISPTHRIRTWEQIFNFVTATSDEEPPAISVITENVPPPYQELFVWTFVVDTLERSEKMHHLLTKWRPSLKIHPPKAA